MVFDFEFNLCKYTVVTRSGPEILYNYHQEAGLWQGGGWAVPMQVTRWSNGRGEPELNALISNLKYEGLNPVVMTGRPGKQYPTHCHPMGQVRWIISGSQRVGVRITQTDGKPLPPDLQWVELDLEPGDRLELEADTQHWIQLGPQGATYIIANRKG